jgi:aryl-alcohol dehydrogenase-like predicted oxidoreductase
MTRISRRTFFRKTATAAGATLLAPLGARPTAAVSPLARRPFGRTDVDVTLVGFGGGSRFHVTSPDDEYGAELVRQAIEQGVEFVESSANYGDGSSERRIGLAMKTHRSRVFLETKVDARDYDGAMREMERSLKRLQTDRIDLMLHHYLRESEVLDQVARPGGAEHAIRKLIEQKVIRFRGFSCHSPSLTREAIERLEPDAIQLIINATKVPDFESEVLPMAESRGIAVMAMKTSGMGFFLKNNATKPDRIERFGPPADVFKQKNLPTARDFLHYALTLPVTTVLVGIDRPVTLESVLRNAREFEPLTTARMASIAKRAEVFRTTGFWLPNQQRA